jgi:hypothetical protein
LVDSSSRSFEIDLNEVPFILQKKAESSLPELLMKAREEGTIGDLLEQFLSIHRQRISLCIADYDRDIYENYGWDGKRLIYIDPARFYREQNLADPLLCLAEWFKVTEPIRKWLLENARGELPSFDAKINQFLEWQWSHSLREQLGKGTNGLYSGVEVQWNENVRY